MFNVALTAKDIMQSPVITVKDDMSVEEISDLFSGRMISGAPVVNPKGNPVGVVTMNDIMRNEPRREHVISDKVASDFVLQAWVPHFGSDELNGYHLEESETLLAKDIMTPFVYHVEEDTSVKDVAKIMLSAHIHRLFVYNGATIVGVVSALDLLQSYSGIGKYQA